MKKPTLTIGIPTYNEECNIEGLLKSLLKQTKMQYTLQAIIVNSDGSTDKTSLLVQALAKKHKVVKFLNNKTRRGVAVRQNEIIHMTTSDILILINADVLPTTNRTIDNLILPLIKNEADMTCPAAIPLEGHTLLEKILYTSVALKNDVFEHYNNGDNIFTCRGSTRVFNKRLYRNLFFAQSLDEDAFSYLACISQNFRYKYVPKSAIYYKLPDNLRDHENQSIRFFGAKTKLSDKFGYTLVRNCYKLPVFLLAKEFIIYFLRYPFYLSCYAVLSVYMKLKSYKYQTNNDLWEISKSSKTLIQHI